jgi:hypothetical protein
MKSFIFEFGTVYLEYDSKVFFWQTGVFRCHSNVLMYLIA